MLGRKNVNAIINEIVAKLNTYLKTHSHKILTEAQLNASLVKYPHSLRCDDGNYIAFTSELTGRKTELTLHRMRNMYNIRQQLNTQLTFVVEDRDDELNNRLEIINRMLEAGRTINTQISNNFGVKHTTYEEGRLAGHNMFSSRVNAAWTLSRADGTFEKSLLILDEFKTKFVPPVKPPEYSAPAPVCR